MRGALRELIGDEGEKRVKIGLAKDGSGVGAALGALQAAKQAASGHRVESVSQTDRPQLCLLSVPLLNFSLLLFPFLLTTELELSTMRVTLNEPQPSCTQHTQNYILSASSQQHRIMREQDCIRASEEARADGT